MVDFTVYKAPDHLKLTKERFYQGSRDCGVRAVQPSQPHTIFQHRPAPVLDSISTVRIL